MGSVVTFCLNRDIIQGLETSPFNDELILVCTKDDNINSVLKDLERRKENLELVILGSDFSEPIQMAQRIHSIDKTISTIVVCRDEDLQRVKQAFQFAVFVGEYVDCVSEKDIEKILSAAGRAIQRTRSRRHHSRVLKHVNLSIASRLPAPSEAATVHLDKLLDYAPVGVAFIDADGRILAWNKKATQITNATERDVITRTIDSIFQMGATASINSLYSEVIGSGTTRSIEGVLGLESEVRHFELTFGPLALDDAKNLMVVFHDITEQKRARDGLQLAKEHAESANIAKSRFLANMSHEIRTPIGAILGFLDLMQQPKVSPSDLHNFIATIDRNGHQLLRLIDDILDLSKIEAGKITLQRTRMSLMELLSDLSSLMSFRAKEKGLQFHVCFNTPIPEYIESDLVRVRQILSNVIGNAIKFTESGRICLSLAYENSVLNIEIADTGIGLSPEQAVNLFEPFMQADPSITRRYGGTGLGLALSKKIVEALGGELKLASTELGRGTTFTISLPIKASLDSSYSDVEGLSADSKKLQDTLIKENELVGMRILLVEDSPDNQVLVSRFLLAEGAAVDFADNGLEGIQKATSEVYNVVLMDMQMPLCGGLEATKCLRTQGYDRPIVALTAHAMEEERRKAFAAGCTDYLTKPINKRNLISVLARYRLA